MLTNEEYKGCVAAGITALTSACFPVVVYLGSQYQSGLWIWVGFVQIGQVVPPVIWLLWSYRKIFVEGNPFSRFPVKEIFMPPPCPGRGRRWLPLLMLFVARGQAHALWVGATFANAAAVSLVSVLWPLCLMAFLGLMFPTGMFTARTIRTRMMLLVIVAIVGVVMVGTSHEGSALAQGTAWGIVLGIFLGFARAASSGMSVSASLLYGRRMVRLIGANDHNTRVWMGLSSIVFSMISTAIVFILLGLATSNPIQAGNIVVALGGGAIVGFSAIAAQWANTYSRHININMVILLEVALVPLLLVLVGVDLGNIPLFVSGAVLIGYGSWKAQTLPLQNQTTNV